MRRTVSLLLVLVMCLSETVLAASFPDVNSNADYAEAVDYMSEIGIMVGNEQGNFNPVKTVTRAEMATVICRLMGEDEGSPTEQALFPDVPVGHWANSYVSKAAELGVVNGYDNGNFGPADTVTYEQAVTMVMRAMGCEGFAQASGGYPDGYLTVAEEFGYLGGLHLSIGDKMSRSDVAVLLYNCCYFA